MPDVELFQKIRDKVRSDPLSLQMGTWIDRRPDGPPLCGMAACIGGWAVYLSDGPEVFCDAAGLRGEHRRQLDYCFGPEGEVMTVESRARELLCLTGSQSDALFFDMDTNADNFTAKVRQHVGVDI